MHVLLLIAVFVVATCGLIYELVAGTLASYLLGDSVTQFSTVIGVYLFSMGIGSFLSRFFNRNLIAWFVQIEILVGLVGGISSPILFCLFDVVSYFRFFLYFFVFSTGCLVGLEIPLLMRVLKDKYEFSDLVSRIFTFDYIGALLASLIFPLVLVPYLGLIKTSLLFGIMNVIVAFIICHKLGTGIRWAFFLKMQAFAVALILGIAFVFASKIQNWAETSVYNEPIIFANSSPYQRLVVTRNKQDVKLYLNGNLQFNSKDEYRYHEALVHPAVASHPNPENVLVLGGGDGLALREIQKYPTVKKITLVDLDPSVTKLFSSHPMFTELNKNSFKDNRMTVVNADAYLWLKQTKTVFDVAIIDFPDPSNYSVGKLYSYSFYNELKKHLRANGIAVIQSTSPLVAPKSFNCVNSTLKALGFNTIPYHAYVPSFGDWGYLMALGKDAVLSESLKLPADLRYFDSQLWVQMRSFPKDIPFPEVAINRLNNQVLVHYFEEEWEHVAQ